MRSTPSSLNSSYSLDRRAVKNMTALKTRQSKIRGVVQAQCYAIFHTCAKFLTSLCLIAPEELASTHINGAVFKLS
jgi:hypothetical protein